MSLVDRDAIERRDFPVGRRGYDPAAVDAHLRRVADEFETLRARPAPSASSISTGASEQVRVILEAAEESAERLRADAGREAGEHVERVREATGGMLARLDELEHELGTLLAALRQSAAKLNEGLAQLQREVGHVDTPPADPGEPPVTGEDFAAAGEPPVTGEDFAAAGDDLAAAGEPPATGEDLAAPAPADEPAPVATPNGDEAGARLIALNMALSGTPREETARYLAEHFALADADALLDDVYARAGR
jgi:DivIVA domain-containing protein